MKSQRAFGADAVDRPSEIENREDRAKIPHARREDRLRRGEPDHGQHRRHPISEQEQIHQAAEVDDPQQHGLQRIALAEQHHTEQRFDRVFPRQIDGVGTALRRRNIEALQHRRMVPAQVLLGGEKARRFREPQHQGRHQDKRDCPAQDKDHRPAEIRQQQGHDLPTEKAPDRRASETHHDHHRAPARRRVVAGQRGRAGKPAADPEPGEKAPQLQRVERPGGSA